jgi:hypothetical protein
MTESRTYYFVVDTSGARRQNEKLPEHRSKNQGLQLDVEGFVPGHGACYDTHGTQWLALLWSLQKRFMLRVLASSLRGQGTCFDNAVAVSLQGRHSKPSKHKPLTIRIKSADSVKSRGISIWRI